MQNFRSWRLAHQLTLEKAAEELGLSKTRAHALDHGGTCSLGRALEIEAKTGISHRGLVKAYRTKEAA